MVLKKYGGRAAEELDTTEGRLTMLSKAWEGLKRAIGDLFTNQGKGQFNSLISFLTSMLRWVKDNINVVLALGKVIIGLATAYGVYKGILMVVDGWQKIVAIGKTALNAISETFLKLSKSELLMSNEMKIARMAENRELLQAAINKIAVKDASKAANIAMIAETNATEAATVAQETLNTAQKANMWGLILSLIAMAITYLIEFASKTSEAAEAQQKFENSLNESVGATNALFEQLKQTNAGTKERADLVQMLNDKYPELVKNYDLENASLKEIDEIQKEINANLIKKITLDAKSAAISELGKKQAEILIELQKEGVTYQDIYADRANKATENNVKNAGGITVVTQSMKMFSDAAEDMIQNYRDMDDQIAETAKSYDDIAASITNALSSAVDDASTQGETLAELKARWSKMSIEELEAELQEGKRVGVEMAGYSKDQISALQKIINFKKKSYDKGISDYEKYITKFEELQGQVSDIENTNFTETLSKTDREINAVNEKYDKLIAAEKKYIDDVSKIKDPSTRAKLQPQVDQAGANVKELEIEKNQQLDKVILNAEADLAKEVLDINKKVARALMSLQEQQLQDIDDHYDKLITDARDAEAKVYEEKLKAINTEIISQEEKDKALQDLAIWHQQQLDNIQAQADVVNTEREKQKAEKKKQFNEDLEKQIHELKKKYNQLSLENQKQDELDELESKHTLFKSDVEWKAFYEAAKLEITKKYAKLEKDETAKLFADKIKKYQGYFQSAASIENSLSNVVTSLKNAELANAGENTEKQKQIRKKYADFEFALAIANIITQTSLGAMAAIAEGGPYVGEVMAGLIIAEGLAAGIEAYAQWDAVKSLAVGGPTGSGTGPIDSSGHKVAGVVHANEYVIPAWEREIPMVQSFENIIEAIRLNKYAMGGAVMPAPSTPVTERSRNEESINSAVNSRLADVLEKIYNNGIAASVDYRKLKEVETNEATNNAKFGM